MRQDGPARHDETRSAGLTREEVRRIALDKLQIVYDDWGFEGRPFEDFATAAGERREDARAFVIALVAALVGGFAEALDRNNALIASSRRLRPRGRSHLRSLRELDGYRVEGPSGVLANVLDAYFDDQSWTVRYLMVVGVGHGASTVLLSPHSVRRIDRRRRTIVTALTPSQFRAMPGVDAEPAIPRTAEIGLLRYYGFPYYWIGHDRWGDDRAPRPLPATLVTGAGASGPTPASETRLRSVRDLRRYTIHATDGELGHVDDLLVEDRTWAVRYLVVDTRRWWPGAHVLLSPEWVSHVSWVERSVHVSLERARIRTAPAYDRTRPLDRAYEAHLHQHYGRPTYWPGHAA